jgi:predicted Zn-dependent protease
MSRRSLLQTAIRGINSALASRGKAGAASTNLFSSASFISSASARFPTRTTTLHQILQQQRSKSSWGRPPRDDGRGRVVVWNTRQGRDGYTRFGGSQRQLITPKQKIVLVVLGTGGTIIYINSRQEIPYTGRVHAILVNPDQELQLGEQTYAQVLAQAKREGSLLPANHPASLAVRRVGTRIAAIASDGAGGGFHSHMHGLKWEFSVIHSPDINAFVVPGGKVVVYTGLLNLLKTDDELAAVIAHEAGHVVARHTAERLTQGSVVELLRYVAYYVFGIPIPSAPLTTIFFLPNSRKAETEADVIGLQLASRACYDPAAAAVVFTKLGEEEAKHGADLTPKMLRTHPVTSDRIKKINEMLPKAQSLREAAGCNIGILDAFERGVIGRLGSGW